ncbi:MAG TPA: LamG domain-containing protein [Chthoniobacteraceae bacterium]|nr:LamG domain-containing protein [Chthoniobacteraceae bacterium]
MNRILPLVCLLLFSVVLTAQTPPASPAKTAAPQLAVDLFDHSRVIGTPSADHFKIATDYAAADLPLAEFRSVEFDAGADHPARVSLQNGDLIKAKFSLTEIALKTSYGDIVIPMEKVARIEVLNGGVFAGKPLPAGCVLRYAFDKDEGTDIVDSSGSGYNGTPVGASYVSVGRKEGGGSESFNGRGEVVTVKGDGEKLKTQDFTIMAWVRRGRLNMITVDSQFASYGEPHAVIFGGGAGAYSFGMQQDGSLLLEKTGAGGTFSTCQVNDESFHHVAVTRKDKKVVFYLDGVAFPSADLGPDFEFNTAFAAGAEPMQHVNGILGLMSELAVFNRGLTGDEIKAVYESQKPPAAQKADAAAEAASAVPDASTPQLAQLALELADGSSIVGAPPEGDGGKLKLTTQFADVEIQVARIRTVEFTGPDRAVEIGLQNGDQLKGRLAAANGIALKTSFGAVTIPLAQIVRLRAVGTPLPDGLVFYFPLDRLEGKRVPDASGSGNDGVLVGAPAIASINGRRGMNFDGDGQMISLGDPKALHLQNFTIMAWIKRATAGKVCKTSSWADLVSYPHGGFGFGIEGGGNLYLNKADFAGSFCNVGINDEGFHHVAVTKDGGTVVFYIDGVAHPGPPMQGEFVFDADAAVGGRSDSFQNTFLGAMSGVAMFNRPLSAAEIKAVYDSQR